MRARRLGDLRVQVDGRDQLVAEPVREQRGVVAGAGADLQDRGRPSRTSSSASIRAISEGWLLEEISSPSRTRVASGASA